MISRAEAERRVARGAAHLDRVRPNWFNQIDTGTLTLHDPCGCIVGQLCGVKPWADGMFNAGIRLLFGTYGYHPDTELRTASHYGVDLEVTQASRANFLVIQDAWIAAIAARRFPEPQDVSATADAVTPPVDARSGLLRA